NPDKSLIDAHAYLSERELQPDRRRREAWLRRQRPLRRIVELLADDIELDLHEADRIPVHAERRHLIAVAEDDVGTRTRRRRFAGRAALEFEALDARRHLDVADAP